MRVMRVTLLLLPLALLLSTAAFGAPANEPTPLTLEQLEVAIFGPPLSVDAPPVFPTGGRCSATCEQCWTAADCPKIGGRSQICAFACN